MELEFLHQVITDYLFVYIFSFGCLIFLAMSFYFKKRFLKNICLVLFSVFSVLCFFEIVLAFQMDVFRYSDPDKELADEREKFYIQHKIYIEENDRQKKRYVFKEEAEKDLFLSKKQYNKIYDVNYSVFGTFFRYTKGNLFSKNAYIFLGCFFTFGEGLNDDQTLPYYFSKMMRFKSNVLNCGMIGRSTNFSLNILNSNLIDRYAGRTKNKHFIYSLISDQIMRNFNFIQYGRSDNWLYKDGKWTRAKQPFEMVQIIFAKSYIFRKIFLPLIDQSNERFYEDYMIESLKEIRSLAKSKYGADFTIIVWPSIDVSFKKRLASEKFDIISLPDYFEPLEDENQYKIPYDDHPTAKANEEIAELLYNHINKNIAAEADGDD